MPETKGSSLAQPSAPVLLVSGLSSCTELRSLGQCRLYSRTASLASAALTLSLLPAATELRYPSPCPDCPSARKSLQSEA